MGLAERYLNAKNKMKENILLCSENRDLFLKFLEYEEYKLKRKNRAGQLDDNSLKTLLAYVSRLQTVNRWFDNKPWESLSKEDIKKVYDDLEDGKIMTRTGRPFKDKATYYKQIIRSKPFAMAGKRELVEEAMPFYSGTTRDEVRFITEEDFRQLVSVVIRPEHKCLLWLSWDIGENSGSLLRLRTSDFARQINEDTKQPEYFINLRQEILKRSRTSRTEISNYQETVDALDKRLEGKSGSDLVFSFGHRMAEKILERAVRLTGVRCIPAGQKVTLKDLRSSMACHLLRKGWTTDEVNCRLGHRPSSKEIDKYVNFLAVDRRVLKKKLHETELQRAQSELQKHKATEQLAIARLQQYAEIQEALQGDLQETKEDLRQLKAIVQRLLVRQSKTA